MKEQLELVVDFATLRAGMIVVVKDCGCGKNLCRSMLTCLDQCDEDYDNAVGWQALPPCFEDDREGLVTKGMIEDRAVYRVVDGLDQSTETRKSVTA